MDIADKVKTGTIFLGMSLQELKAILGQPDAWGGCTRKYKAPCVFKYGKMEFGFTLARNQDCPQSLIYVMDEDHNFLLNKHPWPAEF